MRVKALNISILRVSVDSTFFALVPGQGKLFSLGEGRQGRGILGAAVVQDQKGLSPHKRPAAPSSASSLPSSIPVPLSHRIGTQPHQTPLQPFSDEGVTGPPWPRRTGWSRGRQVSRCVQVSGTSMVLGLLSQVCHRVTVTWTGSLTLGDF